MAHADDDLVQVLVPKRYVLNVYGFLAKLDAVGPGDEDEGNRSPLPGGTQGASHLKAKPWTVQDLRRFAESGNPTTTLVTRMLDVLADRRDEKIATSEIVKLLGVERSRLRGTLAALTRHIKAHYDRSNWPMKFEWSGTEATYRIPPDVAELWVEIRSPQA